MASSQEPRHLLSWQFTNLNHINMHVYGQGLILLLIFFSIVIVLTSLFLYAHCVCGHRQPSDTDSAVAVPPVSSLGLDSATIDGLPIILHKSSMTNNVGNTNANAIAVGGSECCICLNVFEDEEKVKVLPECNHAYHPQCVDLWLSTQSSCPLCRASLIPLYP